MMCKKITFSFSKILLCFLILFSFHACSFFEDDVKETSSESSQVQSQKQPETEIIPDNTKKTLILSFTPYFGDASRTGSRSAYPEFSNTQLAAYTYTIESEHFSETTAYLRYYQCKWRGAGPAELGATQTQRERRQQTCAGRCARCPAINH